jgi:hypothetical protein
MPLPALLYQTQRATSLLVFPQWVSPKNVIKIYERWHTSGVRLFHFWKVLWDFTFCGFAKGAL